MPRAHRYFLPGHVWHITHRCHEQAFLLKFARDRIRWRQWLYKAKQRYGLCILNYVVTSNHIHLLVKDTGEHVIARSLQLVAGRTAQEYNDRKGRKGAFWEDRYHATAVATDQHLLRCLVYIDLNMVRAGVVSHPADWVHGGYREIQQPPARYRLIDMEALMALIGVNTPQQLQHHHRQWVNDELAVNTLARDAAWSESLAVGNEAFVNEVQGLLGIKAKSRQATEAEGKFVLRETPGRYHASYDNEKASISSENRLRWDVI